MGTFLNSRIPCEAYKAAVSGKYFVDKSKLIEELLPALGTEERFYCLTRPRRFGKSIMANMIGAFFGKAENTRLIFDTLEISKCNHYTEHVNSHNVIYIDFSQVPRDCTTYIQYITHFQDGINEDLAANYPHLKINIPDATWDILTDIFQKTGDKFIWC